MATITIEKKHLYFLCGVFGVLLGMMITNAITPYSSNRPWHPLQQVSTDEIGSSSVDANTNGIIDSADTLASIPPAQFCRSDNSNCPSACKDFKVETTTVQISSDWNDGGDPDCWIFAAGCLASWGEGTVATASPEYCARTAPIFASAGEGWIYYGYDNFVHYNPGPAQCGGDVRYDAFRAKYYRISASCEIDGTYKTFVFNSSSFFF